MIYDTDEITFNSVVQNPLSGKETSTPTTIPCRVDDFNKVVYNDKGEKAQASMMILIDFDKLASIKYEDKFTVTKKFGLPFYDSARESKILSIEMIGAVNPTHWQVFI